MSISHLPVSALKLGCALFLAAAVWPACAQQAAPAPATVAPAVTTATGLPGGTAAFVHPGLLHTAADFARMKAKVDGGASPWIEGWKALIANPHSQLSWRPRPSDKVIRGQVPGQNVGAFYNDVHAAYQCALRWKVSGDTAYADKSLEILNAWSLALKEVGGNADRFLASGIYGYEFANAAEIMRTYPGWQTEDFARFQNLMLRVFYPMNHDFLTRHNGAAITNYWSNWDLSNMASLLAIGVLCDRRDIYDEAITYCKAGGGNGAVDKAVYYVHPGYLGQMQESGRDQGHNTLSIALLGPICEMAWNQGEDLYGYENNRLLAGAEYTAKYNLGLDVPFQTYSWGTGQKGTPQTQTAISGASRGNVRPEWELIYNHYANRKGIAAPYAAQFAAKVRPEGGGGNFGPNSGGFDQLGFGTLTYSLDPQVSSPRPSGLTARKSGDDVVLSWWGVPDAASYTVKRADKAGGPYSVVTAGVRDLLTYTEAAPRSGARYYIVTALRNDKETPASNEVKVTSLPALTAELKFDETSGPSAWDAVTHAPLGALNGGATWAAGKSGNTLVLDGKDGYLGLPADTLSGLADFTVVAWVYCDAPQAWARVFDFGDDRGRYLFLTPRNGGGKVRFATSTVYGYNEQVIDGAEALPVGQWIHVAVTLAGRTGTLYVNGTAVGSNPAMDFPPYQIGATARNYLGRSQFPNDPYFKGKIDDFRVYDGALSARDVAALAASTP